MAKIVGESRQEQLVTVNSLQYGTLFTVPSDANTVFIRLDEGCFASLRSGVILRFNDSTLCKPYVGRVTLENE